MSSRFKVGRYIANSDTIFNGIYISSKDDGSVHINIRDYLDKISKIDIDRKAGRSKMTRSLLLKNSIPSPGQSNELIRTRNHPSGSRRLLHDATMNKRSTSPALIRRQSSATRNSALDTFNRIPNTLTRRNSIRSSRLSRLFRRQPRKVIVWTNGLRFRYILPRNQPLSNDRMAYYQA